MILGEDDELDEKDDLYCLLDDWKRYNNVVVIIARGDSGDNIGF